jgi:hypothetical protein
VVSCIVNLPVNAGKFNGKYGTAVNIFKVGKLIYASLPVM